MSLGPPSISSKNWLTHVLRGKVHEIKFTELLTASKKLSGASRDVMSYSEEKSDLKTLGSSDQLPDQARD